MTVPDAPWGVDGSPHFLAVSEIPSGPSFREPVAPNAEIPVGIRFASRPSAVPSRSARPS